MALKAFDVALAVVWTGVILSFLVGMGAFLLLPNERVFYGAESGICDAGCGDPR